MESNPTWIDYLTATGAILTPIFVAILGAIFWRFRARMERRFELENKLREDRIETYNDILEPFVILFMSETAWKTSSKNKNKNKDITLQQALLSLEYRRKAFKMSLVGSDAVVTSYNDLMQYFFQFGINADQGVTESDVKDMMALVGKLLLEIRRSMGNETTKLDQWQMVEWFIKDARRFRNS